MSEKRTEYELSLIIGGKVDDSLAKSVQKSMSTVTSIADKSEDSLGKSAKRTSKTIKEAADDTGDSLSKSARTINSKVDSIGTTLKKAAAIATTAFAALKLSDFISDSNAASKEFETSMAGVAKVVDGLKDDNGKVTESYYEMKDSILDMSTDLPMVAEDIASIVEAAGQSNIASDELAEFAEDATKMGIAFDTTAEQSGEWMAQWRTALDLTQDGVTDLADQINYLGNTTTEKATKLSEVVTRVGSLGKASNVSAASIAALASSMTGVSAEISATAIKNLITDLTAGTAATDTQIEAFESLGLSAEEVSKSMQVDSQETILDVLERISNLSKDKQSATLKNIFGSESLTAIAPLLTNLDNLKTQFDKVGEAALYAGSMEQEYLSASSTSANVDILTENKINAMKIKLGDSLVPLSTTVSEAVGDMAESLGDFIEDKAPLINNAVDSISDAFEEFLPNVVYNLKEFGEESKEFLSNFEPIVDLVKDNPGLITDFLITAGKAMITYKIGKSIGEIAKNVKDVGSPLKLLSGIITNPWALAIGGVAAGVVLLAEGFANVKEELAKEDLASKFGDISLSLDDINEAAEHIVGEANLEQIDTLLSSIANSDDFLDSMEEAAQNMNKIHWKLSVGLELSDDDLSSYQQSAKQYVEDAQEYIANQGYTVEIATNLLLGDAAGELNKENGTFYAELENQVDGLSDELSEILSKSLKDGLTINEEETITNLLGQIQTITDAISQAESQAKLQAIEIEFSGKDLDADSFQNLQQQISEYTEETQEGAKTAYEQAMTSLNAQLNLGDISQNEYNTKSQEYQTGYYQTQADAILNGYNFMKDTIMDTYGDEIEPALDSVDKAIEEKIQDIMYRGDWNEYSTPEEWTDALNSVMTEALNSNTLSSTAKDAIAMLIENMKPTAEQLATLSQQIAETGGEISPELTKSIAEAITSSENLEALTGSESAIWSKIGDSLGDNEKFSTVIETVSQQGTYVAQELIDAMEEKQPEAEDKAKSLLGTIKDTMEEGVNVTVPIGITYETVAGYINSNSTKTSTSFSGFDIGEGWGKISESATSIPGHADGGIFSTPHIAWVAEGNSDEAIIPLDGSNEAIELWRMAGQILGMFEKDPEYEAASYAISDGYNQLVNNSNSSTNISNSNTSPLNIYNYVTVQSGADQEKVNNALALTQEQFNRYMATWEKQQARTRMG